MKQYISLAIIVLSIGTEAVAMEKLKQLKGAKEVLEAQQQEVKKKLREDARRAQQNIYYEWPGTSAPVYCIGNSQPDSSR